MFEINVAAVGVAGVASFAASGAWYAVFGDAVARLQQQWRGAEPKPDPHPIRDSLVFVGTGLVLATAVAVIVGLTDISGALTSLGLGLVLWVGFALTQWIGSIVGEHVPVRLAAIHAGDWLLHMLIISVIVGTWR